MECNVGGVDRWLRLIAGVVLLALGIFMPMATVWQVVLIILGAIGVITGAVRFCPLSKLLGINTCKQAGGGGEQPG